MNRIKEIALLSLPVIAIALAIPAFNWFASNRARQERKLAARQEQLHPTRMRIESCQLKPSTTWDAYHGRDATLWTRSVAPIPPSKPQIFGRNVIDISDLYGTLVATYGRDGCQWTAPQGDAQVVETQEPIKLSEILGNAQTANAHVSFEETDSNCLTIKSIDRNFVLHRPKIVPLESRRKSNFLITKIVLTTNVSGGQMDYQFDFTFAPRGANARGSLALRADGDWVVVPKDNSGSVSLHPVGSQGGNPDSNGVTKLGMTFGVSDSTGAFAAYAIPKINAGLPQKPAIIDVLLSADEGWPQKIHIELPQGLPAAGGKSTVLPFRATLAPLPK